MGGRGSGGGRSGGGGGSASKSELAKFTNRDIDLIDGNSKEFNLAWQKEYSNMDDLELNKAYKSSQRAMNKERKNLEKEREKLRKITDDFAKTSDSDSNYKAKTDAMNKQMAAVDRAANRVKVRETMHYLAVNEKNNIRAKHTVDDLSKMTDGQLKDFFYKSSRESQKAKMKHYNAKTKQAEKKYNAMISFHETNFWKANNERYRRNITETW